MRLKSGRSRVVLGILAIVLAAGFAIGFVTLWLHPALAAETRRDVSALLAARSPGQRLVGAVLNKVAKTLVGDHHPGSDAGTRRRLIPPRNRTEDSPAGLGAEEMQKLLMPLRGLDSPVLTSEIAPAGAPIEGSAPIVLIGGGNPDSGGAGGGGGGTPGASVPPLIGATPLVTPTANSTPVAPVPEPATWMNLLAGFGVMAAALRRRRMAWAAL